MILEQIARVRVKFDINNKTHILWYKNFFITMKWGNTGCPFYLEDPYTNIPQMITDRLIKNYLKIEF